MTDPQTMVSEALDEAYDQFQRFAEDGSHQRFQDTSSDFASEADKALTETFREYFEGLDEDYHILSEEQFGEGMTVDPEADYTVIIDEFDGTFNMMNGLGEDSFGPCIAICEQPESEEKGPKFEQVLASGFLDVPSGNKYLAKKGEGATIIYGDNVVVPKEKRNKTEEIHTSGRESIDGDSPPTVIVDNYMLSELPNEDIGQLHSIGPSGDYRTWAGHMAKIARGGITPSGYDVGVTGNFCKYDDKKLSTAEELAFGYLLVKEAGGTVADWKGNDIGDELIGLHEEKPFNVIVAATPELAKDFAGKLAD